MARTACIFLFVLRGSILIRPILVGSHELDPGAAVDRSAGCDPLQPHVSHLPISHRNGSVGLSRGIQGRGADCTIAGFPRLSQGNGPALGESQHADITALSLIYSPLRCFSVRKASFKLSVAAYVGASLCEKALSCVSTVFFVLLSSSSYSCVVHLPH